MSICVLSQIFWEMPLQLFIFLDCVKPFEVCIFMISFLWDFTLAISLKPSFSWVFLLGCISRRKFRWVLWVLSLTSTSGFSITGEISISSTLGYPFLISVLTKGCLWGNLYIWLHTTFFNCKTLCMLHLS